VTTSKRAAPKAITASTPIGNRLTPRDVELLRLIAEHRILTSTQLATAVIPNDRTCRLRIGVLRDLGLVETFRPPRVTGSTPLHCVATFKALRLLAEAGYADRVPTPGGAARPGAVAAGTALRADLSHLTGANEVFCQLRAAARASGGRAALEEWRSEWSAARAFGSQIRPDGFARWRDGTAWCEFFLEYDTGTEALHRLTAKLRGYADLAAATAVSVPVLFWLPGAEREQNLHRAFAVDSSDVPVATTHGNPRTNDPHLAVWHPVWEPGGQRFTLASLGAASAAHLGVPQRRHAV
jgi:hypothetical protein